ncbi:MAG: phasyl DNA replicon protein arp [Neisseriaceae bacterium]|nr:phasyl DNA replicon protein arp [Neisseriaceae bacterium]
MNAKLIETEETTGGGTAATQTDSRRTCSPVAGGVSPSAVPCLNKNNSINKFNELSTSHKKSTYALELNSHSFVKHCGFNRVGFLTLTFADDIQDRQEAQRRFNSLRTNFLNNHFKGYVRVMERCKSGRIHYHLLVDCGCDIRSGLDFRKLQAKDYRSANANLRRFWRLLRSELPKYGFGRAELLPIKTNEKQLAKYISKYIGKHIEQRKPEDKGARLCQFSSNGVWKVATTRFAFWSDGYREWLRKLRLFVDLTISSLSKHYGIFPLSDEIEEIDKFLKGVLGNKWIFNNADNIFNIDNTLERLGYVSNTR